MINYLNLMPTFKNIIGSFSSNIEAMEFWNEYRNSENYDENFEKYLTKYYNHYYVESDINGYICLFYIGNIRENGEIL